ncbi:MAG: hypothetical protein LBG60_17460, partial [Bifidobacteriaceae bacterium]|nr:hypothetical protein [Bifidobacteriaceae bacterium]
MTPTQRSRPSSGARRGAASVLAACCLVAAVGGCTAKSPGAGAASDPAGTTAGPDQSDSASTAADLPQARRWTDAPAGLPLSPYFDAVARLSEALTAEAEGLGQEWFDNQEAFVAQCMAERGFTYFPQSNQESNQASNQASGGGQPYTRPQHYLAIPRLADDRAAVAKVGYGVQAAPPAPGQGADYAQASPNADYYDSLSLAGQMSYDDSLYGPDQAMYWRGETDAPPDEMGGCLGTAWAQFPDPAAERAAASPLTQFAELISKMRLATGLDMFDAPELVQLNQEWRDCLPPDLAALLGDPAAIAAGPYGGPPGAFELALRTTAD